MRLATVLLGLLSVLCAFSHDRAHAGRPSSPPFQIAASVPGTSVWVLGRRWSNTYHTCACPRVQRHRVSARKMPLRDAIALGLKPHRGCRP
jgi:hypothetical protein